MRKAANRHKKALHNPLFSRAGCEGVGALGSQEFVQRVFNGFPGIRGFERQATPLNGVNPRGELRVCAPPGAVVINGV